MKRLFEENRINTLFDKPVGKWTLSGSDKTTGAIKDLSAFGAVNSATGEIDWSVEGSIVYTATKESNFEDGTQKFVMSAGPILNFAAPVDISKPIILGMGDSADWDVTVTEINSAEFTLRPTGHAYAVYRSGNGGEDLAFVSSIGQPLTIYGATGPKGIDVLDMVKKIVLAAGGEIRYDEGDSTVKGYIPPSSLEYTDASKQHVLVKGLPKEIWIHWVGTEIYAIHLTGK